MPVVDSSLDALLFLFAGAFSAPTFQTFRMLVVGFICQVGEHSVCGMLQGARLERVWHHSRAHALFAYRKWCPDELGLLLLDFLVAALVPRDAAVRLAVDDSLFGRSGKQVYGAAWQYDGSQSCGQGPKIGYGNNFVIVTLIVRLPCMERAVSVPLLARGRHAFCVSVVGRLTVTLVVSSCDSQIALSGMRSPKWMRNAARAELQS